MADEKQDAATPAASGIPNWLHDVIEILEAIIGVIPNIVTDPAQAEQRDSVIGKVTALKAKVTVK